jgi:hypothetical protein
VSERHVEHLTTNGHWLLLCGLAFTFFARTSGIGFFTGFALAQTGAFFLALQMWRSERGL